MDDRKRPGVGAATVPTSSVLVYLGPVLGVHSRELDFVTTLRTRGNTGKKTSFFSDELVAHVERATVVTASLVGASRPILPSLVRDRFSHG